MAAESAPKDDLDAVRVVVATIEPFGPEDRIRIMRWASEKLGLSAPHPTGAAPPPPPHLSDTSITSHHGHDLRSFIADKQPGSDTQFAAAVAYYYAFDAPEADQKVTINAAVLQEACRLANRPRIGNLRSTLNNAVRDGYLDRVERGSYRVNTVGENLVAMALPARPDGEPTRVSRSRPSRAKKTGANKSSAKGSSSKKSPAKRTATKNTPSGRAPRR